MSSIIDINFYNDCDDNQINGFNVDIKTEMMDVNTFVNSSGYVPSKNDTLYLLPGVNIPRVKLKDLALNLGIRIVRDVEKANIIFAGKNSIGKMTSSQWRYSGPSEVVLNKVKELCNDQHYVDKLETAIAATNATLVYSDYRSMRDYAGKDYSSAYTYSVDNDYLDVYNRIQGLPIYDEAELIANINGDDSTVIDDQVFAQLTNMFDSSDSDNHVLAMEIMANSNYEKSILYLLMLIDENHRTIDNTNTRNHVNFKSMCGYFGWKPADIRSLDPDDIVKIIDAKGFLTVDMIKILYSRYTRDITGNFNYDNVFEVKEVTIKQEYLDKLNLISLDLVNPKEVPVEAPVIEEEEEEEIVTDELIEAALTNVNHNELKTESIALEDTFTTDTIETEEIKDIKPITNKDDTNNVDWF